MKKLITELEKQMKAAARALEFEKAADLRDRIARLKEQIGEIDE
ncbi:MAG TPA: UvrB/UvrC motif-containing protein [Candidatus Atribacteria bacterium]|nr:UvrB/UvrC motif-containing protein [Candidatus Atribacteria bacterium]